MPCLHPLCFISQQGLGTLTDPLHHSSGFTARAQCWDHDVCLWLLIPNSWDLWGGTCLPEWEQGELEATSEIRKGGFFP